MTPSPILTVGHSDHPLAKFVKLLTQSSVDTIFDVRSWPHSRRNPHFDRTQLKQSLEDAGISYFFTGKSLGGRPRDPSLFRDDGGADYIAMAKLPEFAKALQQVVRAAEKHRVALMCSESEPLDCHRCLLVGRALVSQGCQVAHIRANGEIEPHSVSEKRLVNLEAIPAGDLFLSPTGLLDLAYQRRAGRVAYHEPQKRLDQQGHLAQ